MSTPRKIPITRSNKPIIYKTTNLVNNMIYVGQDSNNNQNYLGSGNLIKKAIKKYGKNNFIKEIIEYCDNETELNLREQYWIKYYNSQDKSIGYNIAYGGTNGTMLNRTHSNETKEKMSEIAKGRIFSKTHKENLSLAHLGKKLSDETKNKISQNNPNKNKKLSPLSYEIKNKISESKKGKKLSDETKYKMSISHLGDKNHFFGKKHSNESLLKIRKKIIQLTINDEYIKTWDSLSDAAKNLNINISGISSVLKGNYKITGGFKFKYYE